LESYHQAGSSNGIHAEDDGEEQVAAADDGHQVGQREQGNEGSIARNMEEGITLPCHPLKG